MSGSGGHVVCSDMPKRKSWGLMAASIASSIDGRSSAGTAETLPALSAPGHKGLEPYVGSTGKLERADQPGRGFEGTHELVVKPAVLRPDRVKNNLCKAHEQRPAHRLINRIFQHPESPSANARVVLTGPQQDGAYCQGQFSGPHG
ncbi:MAG: hypothetical protein JNK19_14810 [Tabrizicola sp.]|nr:hypothetical protein [Tabrizicola sp.]